MSFIIKKIVLFSIYILLAFFIFLELVNLLQFPANITPNLKSIDQYTLILENEIIKDKILNLSGKENHSFDLTNFFLERYLLFI